VRVSFLGYRPKTETRTTKNAAMTYLICYDITDDRLRTRLAKRLEKAGCIRLQKSVFLAPHFDIKRLAILRGGIKRLMPFALSLDESVIAIPIEKDNLSDIVWAGDTTQIQTLTHKALFKLL
jgi:CRISPR-associated endonuclease Cas2